LSEKLRIKYNLRKRSLSEQEQHLALEMPTSETAHAKREREKTFTKKYQGKACATKAQQD
jgi:hypothetical protein